MRSVGKRAHRQVVVAGPAEPAQVRAAAHDLDQEARAELGVGREDRRRRRIEALRRSSPPPSSPSPAHRCPASARTRRSSRRPRSGRRRTRGCRSRAASPVAPQEVVSRSGAAANARDQIRNQHLPFAGRDHVGEQRERLRVDERHGAADHDQRRGERRGRPRATASPPAAASSRRWCSPIRTRPRRRARRSRGPASAIRGSEAARRTRAAPAAPAWAAGTPARTRRRRCR